ncbi:MAG: DUF2256 domain-containing protein [Actinobacteria bacterium]|nr:DUF2256 domain-containing protein [Actinomycetota bacterium]
MRAKIKNGFKPKAKNWENVKYCSKKCGGK